MLSARDVAGRSISTIREPGRLVSVAIAGRSIFVPIILSICPKGEQNNDKQLEHG